MANASQIEEMKRYVFQEMSESEFDAIEERFFEDSDYFYDLMELENDLVDRYVSGKLPARDLARFERSLARFPERKEKVANAKVLRALINEQKSAVATVNSVWQRAAIYLSSKISALQYATGALAILLAIGAGFLLYENLKTQQQLAVLQNERRAQISEKEEQIRHLEEDRQGLQKQVENSREQNETIQQQIGQLKQQISELKNRASMERFPAPTTSSGQVFASLILSPLGRGNPVETKRIPIKPKSTSVNLRVEFPSEPTSASVDVLLDNSVIRHNLKPRESKGKWFLIVTLSIRELGEGEHTLITDGKITNFRLQKTI